jgi:hypothetical protein
LDNNNKIRAIDGYEFSSTKKKEYERFNELIGRKDDQKYLFDKLKGVEILK